MLGKLLKYDLKRNMRWLWILFVCTILFAGITRGINELGKNIMFFKIPIITDCSGKDNNLVVIAKKIANI